MIKRILIVEDSPTQALKLQMILELNGYEVFHGINGVEALKILETERPPDLIISDIVMPEMDGYTFCSKVKANDNTKDIPVILLTQLSNAQDVIKGLQAGADNFISKPYSNKFLFERINDILLNLEVRRRSSNLDSDVDIFFGGQKYKLNSDRLQTLDLLLSTYHNAINKNKELEEKNEELKKLHKELKLNNIQLKKLDKEKNHLLGIAAHDLRSPLGNIAGYIDFLEYSIPENTVEDQKEIFKTLNMVTQYMLSLISDVLDYSKIAAGKLEIHKEDFNFTQFMEQTVMLNNILGSKKNIAISSLYENNTLTVNADQNKLKQVMDNLFSNAFKYSNPNTKVFVNIIPGEKEIIVSVKDQGKGIPENELGNLFQPFAVTSVKTTAGEKSTGLGLVSVKKIVETHEGKIWVKSEVGKGSEFCFSIPYNPTKDLIKDDENHTFSLQNMPKLKLLVTEDEEISEQFLSIISYDISSLILHATSGQEAIKICKENPDLELILMDLSMPGIDGIEATREIRKFNSDIKIVAQTAYALDFKKEAALQAGCDAYLTKPINKQALFTTILELFK